MLLQLCYGKISFIILVPEELLLAVEDDRLFPQFILPVQNFIKFFEKCILNGIHQDASKRIPGTNTAKMVCRNTNVLVGIVLMHDLRL